MTFLAPVWLFAAALAGAVLLLHARRRRRVDVPSVHIWRLLEKTTQRRRSLQWPKINLSLILQVLIVVLLAIMLAQPRIGGAANLDEHVVFVIDASASTQATDVEPSRFEAARDWLTERVAGLGSAFEGRVTVAVAGPVPYLVTARQTEFAAIEPTLAGVKATDGVANWNGVANEIAATMRPGEPTRVIVLGDDIDAAAEIIGAAISDAQIEGRQFGAAGTANVALVGIELRRDGDGDWQVTGNVAFYGGTPTATEVAIRFMRDGDDRYLDFGVFDVPLPEDLALDESAAAPVLIPFEQTLALPGSGSLILDLGDDAGPFDNAAYFKLSAEPRRLEVLVVGNGNPNLERALLAIDNVDVFQAAELPDDESRFDLVIVDGAVVDRQPRTNVLWLDQGRLSGDAEPVPLVDAYFTNWDSDHPLSAGIDWSALADPRGFAVPVLPGSEIVVGTADSSLIQARTVAHGREIRVALAADASDWVSLPSYPVFFANIVDWLGVARGGAQTTTCVVGQLCPLEARLGAAFIIDPAGRLVQTVAVGEAVWLPAGWVVGFLPERAGFYRVEGAAGTIDVAVNTDIGPESDLASDGAELAAPTAIGTPLGQWKWVAALVLLLLVAEAVIAGRGNERFLRRGALARGAPHAGQRRWQVGIRLLATGMVVLAFLSLAFPTRVAVENLVVVAGPDFGIGDNDMNATLARSATEFANVGVVGASSRPFVMSDVGNPAAVIDAVPTDDSVNLEAALRLAAAMLPADRQGRIVLAAGPGEGTGELAASVVRLANRDVAIDFVPDAPPPAGEVLVASVEVPPTIYAGDTFLLNGFIYANGNVEADVTILREGVPLSNSEVSLSPGINRVEAVVAADDAGQQLFEIRVEAAGDVLAENNQNGVVATIGGAPSVLVVTPALEQGALMAEALELQGLGTEVVRPDRAPFYIEGWLEYELVLLMNVPAIDLTTRQQELLADYVELYGGGLIITGGENSFGPGGYYQTPLERVSPLSARVPQQVPGTAIVFVLDRSGSMQALVEGTNRLEIAKAATVEAIGLLHEESQVGVVVFDTEPHFVVPIQERRDAAVEATLGPLQPGGGTELYPALSEALDALAAVDASAKHIVVMTDGLLEPADFAELLAVGTAAGITVSAVAIGGGADVARAEEIARFGGGAFHATQDFRALPSILSLEAMMLSGTPVEIGTAEVFWVDRGADFLAGLPDQLPPLESYVTTAAKDAATVHLGTLNDEGEPTPIMASWRFGAGQVLAFASHGAGHGTQNWLETMQFPLFWGQIARHLLAPYPSQGIHARAVRAGDGVTLVAELVGETGEPLAGQSVVAASDAEGDEIPLREVTPGRYEALLAPEEGTHSYQLTTAELSTSIGVYQGYPQRFDFSHAGNGALESLAMMTGGSAVAGDPLATASNSTWEMTPAWRPWAVVALLLFLLDLVVRYAPGLVTFARARGASIPAKATMARS